jgi:GT2 family glycosyltransferase
VLTSRTSLISERHIGGFVFDPETPGVHFVVELFLDGYPARIARANLYDDELRARGFGDGRHAFAFGLEPETAAFAAVAQVRLANTGELVGEPIRFSRAPVPDRRDGDVRWAGGLRLTGWIDDTRHGEGRILRALVDGAEVAEGRADLWTHVGDGPEARPVRAFDFHLPRRLADGRARNVSIVDESGREIPGSPCAVVAYEGGLARFLEDHADIDSPRLRGRVFERIFPQSLPFADFAGWARAFPPEPAGPRAPGVELPRVAVALIGPADLAASIASLERQIDCLWVAGGLGAGGGQSAFRNEDLRQFLASGAAEAEFVVFALAGALFHPVALSRMAEALALFPESNAAYCDFTIAGADGAEWPVAFSAFDYERMLEQGYCAYLFAVRAAQAREAAEQGVDDLFRMFNMTMDAAGAPTETRKPRPPAHVPGCLARVPAPDVADASPRLARATRAHLDARGRGATVKPGYGSLFPAIRVERPVERGKVSILIPTRDRAEHLRACLHALERTAAGVEVEVIVVDNDSAEPDALAFLAEISQGRARVAHCGGPFHFGRLIGAAASIATGEFILTLCDDVEASREGWLREMLGRLVERDAGAAGPLLRGPSGVVRDAGIVLGPEFAAVSAFRDRVDGDPGYADLLAVARECCAVSAACLLTRRRLFLDCGGFDGVRFPAEFGDVDFGLRLRAKGHRIVFTPHAELIRHGGGSAAGPREPDARAGELRYLRSLWGETLADDPYYSPLLSLDGPPFGALAWPPRSTRPRLPFSAAPRSVPPGF